QLPDGRTQYRTDGGTNFDMADFVKRVANADSFGNETGGEHYYHLLNMPSLGSGVWVHVVLNMHPSHMRGAVGNVEQGVRAHPTAEPGVNYFDALTSFYLQDDAINTLPASAYPATYHLDDLEFYQSAYPENDQQVYSLTAAYAAATN